MLICICENAKKGCHKTCPKGQLYEPARVYNAPWVMYYDIGHIKQLKKKVLREMRENY